MRDIVTEIVDFNRRFAGSDHAVHGDDGANLSLVALGRKLDLLASSAFSFFRGTFHLFAADVVGARAGLALAKDAPRVEVVGDLHLENFGAYRGEPGLVFDVNDFDEVTQGPVDVDLARLATSALLVDGPADHEKEHAASAMVLAWCAEATRLNGRFPLRPITRDKAAGRVKEILDERHGKNEYDFLAANTKGHGKDLHLSAGKSGARSTTASPAGGGGEVPHLKDATAKYAPLAAGEKKEATRALEQYAATLDANGEPELALDEVADVAYRFKGTGSLGRFRVDLLVRDAKGALRIFEVKEALASGLDHAAGAKVDGPNRGAAMAAAIRRLQGAPWPGVGAAELFGASALVREIQPEEEKLKAERYARTGHELADYAAQCGRALARLHLRGGGRALIEAGVAHDGRALAGRILDFARRCAKQVERDHQTFAKSASKVRHALSL